MKNISPDAMPILAEVCMEENNDDVVQSFKEIKLIDDLMGILKVKHLLNHSKGRKSNKEKRFNEIFKARLLEEVKDRMNNN